MKYKICKKCGKKFPLTMNIDGKKRIFSNRKYCLDCSPFNASKTRCGLEPKDVLTKKFLKDEYVVKKKSYDELVEVFDSIRLVNENTKPSTKDIETYSQTRANQNIDWYWLLHHLQGRLDLHEQYKVMLGQQNRFGTEWSYLINLDTIEFEMYHGNYLCFRTSILNLENIFLTTLEK